MKNSLAEIREILDGHVKKLLELEPYWKMCYPCKHNGRCCERANPEISREEWEAIEKYLNKRPKIKETAENNYTMGLRCIFYSPNEEKCLIHDERPLFCRYTPFQLFLGRDKYSCTICLGECSAFIRIHPPKPERIEGSPFYKIETDGDEFRIYLSIEDIPDLKEYTANNRQAPMLRYFKDKK